MKTSIIIITYNELDYIKVCIESIRNFTNKVEYEIIVVDNNSKDGTAQWLIENRDLKVILNDENLGYSKGYNQGIEIANGENILLLSCRTIVTSNWLNNLLYCLNSSDDIGAVGPVTNNATYYQAIDVNFNYMEEIHKFSEGYNQLDQTKWEERLKLIGFCIMIKKSLINKVGLLDELFSPSNFEIDDYCYRISKAGYKLILCKDIFIYHFGSTSSNGDTMYYENEKKFENKWGFNPNYSSNIRHDIIKLIDSPIDRNINVLEIGCACGGTLLKIKSIYKNANLFGIELNKNAAAIASKFADIKFENVEDEVLTYPYEFFDYIIFGDVLEHLYNPWKVIKNIKKYLKSDGKLLVSIPNVMHFSLLKDLINGNWTYTDAGLLDKTHIRFFTLKELQKMLLEAGYTKQEFSMTTVFKSEDDKKFIESLCKLTTKENEDQYNAYQYLIKAYKNDYNDNESEPEFASLVRRVEYDLEREQSLEKIIDKLNKGEIIVSQIIDNIKRNVVNKESIFNIFANFSYQKGRTDLVISFLKASYEYNNKDIDTLYNLGYLMFKLGHNDLSLKFLETIEEKDEEVLTIIEEIEKVRAIQPL